jgi:hypothetical protein
MGKFRAFISYSHSDETAARRLHKRLETFRPPKVEQSPLLRVSPVFQDRDELSTSSDLGGRITEALENSENLIVLCSPRSAASRWVNEEIRAFAALHGVDGIHPVVVGGSPPECLPPALLEATPEPLAADFHTARDGFEDGALKLIAGLTGAPFGFLKDREAARARRRARITFGVATLFAGLTLISGWSAWQAIQATQRAESELARAERAIQAAVSGAEDMVSQMSSDADTGRISVDAAAELLGASEEMVTRVIDLAPENQALTQSYADFLVLLARTYKRAGDQSPAEASATQARDLFTTLEAQGLGA